MAPPPPAPWRQQQHAAVRRAAAVSAPSRCRQVRYRDGQVVSKKGEKFVVESVGDDWDGGSKGRVYTKGKRGKGFA
jgi:hypothetical protein